MSERREELLATLEALYHRGSVRGEPARVAASNTSRGTPHEERRLVKGLVLLLPKVTHEVVTHRR